MILDLEKNLLEPLVILSRIDAKNTGYSTDVYRACEVRGTWRRDVSHTVDAAGNYTPQSVTKIHVPASSFSEYREYVMGGFEGFTLSRGDYVVRGTVSADGVRFADGFVMPYEVTADGFAIHGEATQPQPLPLRVGMNTAQQVIKAMREHGGIAVKTWKDLTRNGSIQCGGIPGVFASCIYIEG